jgi:hypothetical protein
MDKPQADNRDTPTGFSSLTPLLPQVSAHPRVVSHAIGRCGSARQHARANGHPNRSALNPMSNMLIRGFTSCPPPPPVGRSLPPTVSATVSPIFFPTHSAVVASSYRLSCLSLRRSWSALSPRRSSLSRLFKLSTFGDSPRRLCIVVEPLQW